MKFLCIILLMFAASIFNVVYSQFIATAPSRNGVIGNNEYGNHTNGMNAWSDGVRTWYMTWDNTYLYLAVASHLDAYVIYIDTDPLTPANGGNNANGSLAGINFDGTQYGRLPFRANFIAFVRNGGRQSITHNGAGGWNRSTLSPPEIVRTTSGSVQEIRITWNHITGGGGRPNAFNFFMYLNNGHINPYGGNANFAADNDFTDKLNLTARSYFSVASTANGSSTPPFSRLSYINQRAADNIGDYGSSFYDVTVADNQTTSLNTNLTINNALRIEGGNNGVLDIGANTLTLNGAITGNGVLRGNSSSNLTIGGTGALGTLVMDQTTPGTTNVLQNLTMNRASQTLTLNNALRLEGTLNPSAGTIASGGNLTLVSNASGTARVAAGSTNNYITGNVTVERFVPNPNINPSIFRKWRLLALPNNAASLRTAWADGRAPISADEGDKDGAVAYAGSGTLITGHQLTSAGSGYDWWPALGGVSSSSIRFYSPNSGGGSWSSASNTPDVMAAPDKPGYMLFVRGDRTNTLTTSNSLSTTLRPVGSLKMGTQSVAIPDPTDNKYEVLGNPFASAINFAAMRSSNATLIENQYWMWDPTLNNAGGYRLVKQVGSDWRAIPSPFGDGVLEDAFTPSIESGQAVLVQPLEAGNLSILESHKIANPANTIRPFSEPEGNAGLIMANLYRVNAETDKQLIDGTVASFSPNNTAALTDAEDVQRAGNFTSALALAISRGNIALTVEGRPMVSSTDTLQLWLPGAVAKTNYELALFAGEEIVPGGMMVLRDRFTNTETDLMPGSITRYAFAPTSDPASVNSLRFQIVLKAGSILPVNITRLTAREQQGDVAVEWAVASETGVKQYEVQHSTTGANFAKAGVVKAVNNGTSTYNFMHQQPGSGQHFYRLRSEDADGTTQLSQVVKVSIGSSQKGFSVYPTLVSGNQLTVELTGLNKGRYTLQLNDMAGKMLMSTTIQYDGGSAAQNLQLPAGLAAGAYLIRLQGEGSSYHQRIMKD